MNVEWNVKKAARAELQFASVSTKEHGYKDVQNSIRVLNFRPQHSGFIMQNLTSLDCSLVERIIFAGLPRKAFPQK